MQEFAETGGTSSLETFQSTSPSNNGTKNGTITKSNQHLVFDGFTSPPIDTGVGTSQGNLFLDGDHSMVIRYKIYNRFGQLVRRVQLFFIQIDIYLKKYHKSMPVMEITIEMESLNCCYAYKVFVLSINTV